MESILEVFDRYHTSVDLVNTSVASASLTISNTELLTAIVPELEQFSDVVVFKDKAIVSIIGERLHSTVGVADRIFRSARRHRCYDDFAGSFRIEHQPRHR